jgi:rhamnogalacturonyl hydrolase YesR
MKQVFSRFFCLLGVAGFCALPVSCATNRMPPSTFSGASPLQWSQRLADSEMARCGDRLDWKPGGKAKWDYTTGLFTFALLKLDGQVNDARYLKFAEDTIESFIAPDGEINGYKPQDESLDNIAPGRTVLALWQITHDERYRKAAVRLRPQLETQPRTSDGGFWHKQRYPDQMWLDGLYMAEPFYAEYAELFGQPDSFEDIAKQIRLAGEHTYDPKTGLFYHGWDESKSQPWARRPIFGGAPWAGMQWPWWTCSIISRRTIRRGPKSSPGSRNYARVWSNIRIPKPVFGGRSLTKATGRGITSKQRLRACLFMRWPKASIAVISRAAMNRRF